MAKVMVGMSGGVDSSAAALLLKNEGYDVTGVTLRLFAGEDVDEETRTCCALSDVEDARAVCYKLGFEHLVFNFKEHFRENVMDVFARSYLNGETPNPCIECNKKVKFDKMLRRAEELGYDYIATGHYAIREFDETLGKYILKRPKDRSKDQTYVLYGLTQYQLSKTLFPLGVYEKPEIREIAEKYNLVFVPLQSVFDEACKLQPPSYWLEDGVHPTHAGHELVKREWLKGFEKFKV